MRPEEPGPGEVELGLRHTWLWSTACQHLGAEFLERAESRLNGISKKNRRATIRLENVGPDVQLVTISEDGHGGIDWAIEFHKPGKPGKYGRINADGERHDEPASS